MEALERLSTGDGHGRMDLLHELRAAHQAAAWAAAQVAGPKAGRVGVGLGRAIFFCVFFGVCLGSWDLVFVWGFGSFRVLSLSWNGEAFKVI